MKSGFFPDSDENSGRIPYFWGELRCLVEKAKGKHFKHLDTLSDVYCFSTCQSS